MGQVIPMKRKMDEGLSSVGAFVVIMSFTSVPAGILFGYGWRLFRWAAGWGY